MSAPAVIPLFDDLVAALEPTLRSVAPFMLTRLLLRAGIFDRTTMTLSDFERGRRVIETGMREALSPGEFQVVEARMEAVVQRHREEG